MSPDHPLDRPAWSALTTTQKSLALGSAQAVRLRPEMGVFVAAADVSAPSLAAMGELIGRYPGAGLFEQEGSELDGRFPAGVEVVNRVVCIQMTAEVLAARGVRGDPAITPLDEADARDMSELAGLTRPGPYRAATHRLGDFIGIREGGVLIAMAGQRLRLDGFTEISAVCTHPDHRGRGLARTLMQVQAERILSAGAVPFLHAAESNPAAIGLYETLGFRARERIAYVVTAD